MPKYMPEGLLNHTPENRAFTASLAGLERAMASGAILEETALLCDGEMNLHFDLGGVEGIMPRGEAVLCRPGETVKDIALLTRVGKPVCFRVTSLREENGRPVALLSRREAQRECIANYLGDLIPGDILRVRVTHLEGFGAFADVGCGVSALMPVDALSVSRIPHPRERLTCGSYVYAVIRSIDPDTGRFFLSQKELLGTWAENAARFSVGQTVAGVVRSFESYGIFIELAPNLAGLAELRPDLTPDSVRPGDLAAVYIKSILPERMKVKLILIDSLPARREPQPVRYFTDCERVTHLDRWQYSPPESARLVVSEFSPAG